MIWNRSKYYKSIYDCPIWNWLKATREDDYKYLLIKGKHVEKKAIEAYEAIQEEYIQTFGIPPEYLVYLQKMKLVSKEFAKYAKSGDRFALQMAGIKEREALALLPEKSQEPIPNIFAKLSMNLGFHVDPKKITVADFYGYLAK